MTDIRVTRQGDVLHLELARPEKKNALTGAMYRSLVMALHEADASRMGAIVLSGNGCFTAGNDITDFLNFTGDMMESPAAKFIFALAACETPLVAAVEGLAIGIGATLLLHCDLVSAAPDARFRMPFADLGLVPEAGASLLLPARVGRVKAAEWLLLAEGFTPQEALETGLINAILPADELLAHALSVAQKLAAKPRDALRRSRALMRGNGRDLHAHMVAELRAFGEVLHSDAARAALAAFMARKA